MPDNLLSLIAISMAGIALLTAIISLFFANRIRLWRYYFRKEHQPENLEEIIASIASKIKNLETGQEHHTELIEQIMRTLAHAVQHVGMVRFNALQDEGGNLSFALALLDAEQNGIMITNLHGRQNNRLYTKRILKGVGETSLSEEEQNALFFALKPKKSDINSN